MLIGARPYTFQARSAVPAFKARQRYGSTPEPAKLPLQEFELILDPKAVGIPPRNNRLQRNFPTPQNLPIAQKIGEEVENLLKAQNNQNTWQEGQNKVEVKHSLLPRIEFTGTKEQLALVVQRLAELKILDPTKVSLNITEDPQKQPPTIF